MTLHLQLDREQLSRFCERWEVSELALFGSVLRADFRSDSDIDILVTFDPKARRTLFDLTDMSDELGRIFGRPVDLVSRRGIERSLNPRRRRAILDSAQTVYVAWKSSARLPGESPTRHAGNFPPWPGHR